MSDKITTDITTLEELKECAKKADQALEKMFSVNNEGKIEKFVNLAIDLSKKELIPSVWELFPYAEVITPVDGKPDKIDIWEEEPSWNRFDVCYLVPVNMGEYYETGTTVKNIWDIKFEGTGKDAIIYKPDKYEDDCDDEDGEDDE